MFGLLYFDCITKNTNITIKKSYYYNKDGQKYVSLNYQPCMTSEIHSHCAFFF